MEISISNADFLTSVLETPSQCESIISDVDFKLSVKNNVINSSNLDKVKSERKVNSLSERIVTYQDKIASVEAELSTKTEGTEEYQALALRKSTLQSQLNELLFKQSLGEEAKDVLDDNMEVLEAQAFVALYEQFKSELEARKVTLEA